jgi:hypothetical protein
VIAANEEMARFMILADAILADQDKVGQEDSKRHHAYQPAHELHMLTLVHSSGNC